MTFKDSVEYHKEETLKTVMDICGTEDGEAISNYTQTECEVNLETNLAIANLIRYTKNNKRVNLDRHY